MASTFGTRMADRRKELDMSQADLCKLMKTSTSVIGRYERDEMLPSIDVARTLAKFLKTTVGYLLGEVDKSDTFKDPVMLRRLHDLQALSDQDRDHILYALDGLLRDAKARKAYA
jgi:transcriptional regulator with XRE-family HTH domain